MQYYFTVFAKKIAYPLLVVLGEKDDVVLPIQTERVFNAAIEPKILLRFEETDHFYKRNEKSFE